jgi:hypothetical protein
MTRRTAIVLGLVTVLVSIEAPGTALAQTGAPLTIRPQAPAVTPPENVNETPPKNPPPTTPAPARVKGLLRFYADGNVRDAISKSIGVTPAASVTESDDKAGSARIGIEVVDFDKERSKSGSVAVASTLKRVQDNFVSTVLVPGNADGLHAMMVEYHGTFHAKTAGESVKGLKALLKRHHLYLAIASSDWDSAGTAINAVTFGAGVLRTIPIWQGSGRQPELGIAAEFGPSFRSIGGDITLDRHDVFRDGALGTSKKVFGGFEGGLQIRIGETTASFHLYRYFPPGGEDVPGLTKTQVVALINVRGALYSEDLK